MKHLIISLKTADQILNDFKHAFHKAKKRAVREPHYEISFDNKADFNRFVRNIPVLSAIIAYKPRSVYELATLMEIDVSNLNKVIQFFEEIGVVKIKSAKVHGRTVKQPSVEYGEVTFRLVA